ncbi:MAG: hypothetical protein ABIG61_17790 [Planctomycetota bacterium]
MSELSMLITAIIGGLSTGGVMCAMLMYLLKNKVGQEAINLCKAEREKATVLYHNEATSERKDIRRQLERDREISDRNHKENRQVIIENSQTIEKHYRENRKNQKLMRKGISYIFAKQFDKMDKLKELEGLKGDASMMVEGLIEDLNGDDENEN